jgi:hypothetical protein
MYVQTVRTTQTFMTLIDPCFTYLNKMKRIKRSLSFNAVGKIGPTLSSLLDDLDK